MINIVFVFFCLFLPLVLFLIEIVIPVPFLVEELGKFFLILFFFRKKLTSGFFLMLFAGVIFSLTEMIFYSERLFLGNEFLILKRFVFTGIFHSLTFVIFYLMGRKFGVFGLIIALFLNILFHYFYNQVIVFRL